MRKFLLFILCFCFFEIGFSQDFSNKGKEFWLVFPAHVPSSVNAQAQMGIFITSDKNSSGTITVGAFSTSFTVLANQVTGPINIPYADANVGTTNVVVNKGIHVLTNQGEPPVVVYAHIYAGFRSEASLILPVNTLGKKYFSSNFYQRSSNGSQSQFNIVATEKNTVIQYQLRRNGNLDPTPVVVNLPNAGDQIQVQDDDDLSGSVIESIASGTGGCKKIAVFSGSSALAIGSNTCNPNSIDPLYQQCYPVSSWGKNFGVIPFLNNSNGYHVRVTASEDNTIVNFNGTTISLNAGQYYPASAPSPVPFTAPLLISADKPISVSQYLMSGGCAGSASAGNTNNVQGDPDMIILNPVEQNINDINIFSSNLQAIHKKYLSVYIKTIAAPGFRINNAVPTAAFVPMPQNNGYSYLREDLSSSPVNSYRLTADSGFNAITYGMGDAESYGYSAGTNVKDLFQQIQVVSLYGIETVPSVCVSTPFKFKISLPYQPDSMYWDLSPEQSPVWLKPILPAALSFDSSTMVNGVPIWWYSLPLHYTYNAIGSYPITITTYKANADGCGNEQTIDFDLVVSGVPVANFNSVSPICLAEKMQFNDASSTTKPTYRWWWSFGDPASGAANTSNLKNPTHIFSSASSFKVRYANITTAGCLSDTVENLITIDPLPSATVAGTTSVCKGSATPMVTFMGNGSAPPYTFTYNINGGGAQTISTITGSSVSIPVPTNVAGVFRYGLTNVQNTGSALCSQVQSGFADITVKPVPTATITGSKVTCLNSPGPSVLFTGSGSTAPYTFTYNINGGAAKTITTVSGNSVSLTAPTGLAGTFTYNLMSIQDGSVNACSQSLSGISAIVTVNELPVATIIGSTAVCKDAAPPLITFTGAGGTAPYTFSYTVNGIPNTISTITGNSVTISVPTTVAGSFTYVITNVREGGPTGCSQNIFAVTATVLVHDLPSATVGNNRNVCMNASSPLVIFTGSGTTAPYTFTYNLNGGPASSVSSGAGNSFSIPVPTTTAGIYSYNLLAVKDAAACSTVFTGESAVITVSTLPKAAFSLPEVCLLDPFAQFFDSSKVAPGTITGWQWQFGDFNSNAINPDTSSTKNARHKYSLVGPYNVRLVVTSNAGCRDTLTRQLIINGGNPVADFTVLNASSLCDKDSVGIQNKSSISSGVITKLEIFWDNSTNSAEVIDEPQPGRIYSHKYPPFQSPLVKNWVVRLRAYSGGVCFSDKLTTISINASPKVVFGKLPDVCLNVDSYPLNQASAGTMPGTGMYTGTGVVAGPAGSYLFVPKTAGVGLHRITYIFTSSQGGCTDTASEFIRVYANPIVNAGPDLAILKGGSTTLQATVTGDDLQYLWLANSFLSNNRIKNPVVSPIADIVYTLTATGRGNCTGSDQVAVAVLLAPKIPNTFSPNNDGINDSWEIKYLDTYPGCRVQVFTRTGSLVFESKGYRKMWDGTMGGKPLPVDTYYYIIEPESGRKPITGFVTILK